MNAKFLIFIAILLLAGAGYWAFQEGVFDDLLPNSAETDNLSSFQQGKAGPAGPTSKIPGLAQKSTKASAVKPTVKPKTKPKSAK